MQSFVRQKLDEGACLHVGQVQSGNNLRACGISLSGFARAQFYAFVSFVPGAKPYQNASERAARAQTNSVPKALSPQL